MTRREDGFTIVELMIAMMIMGVITVPLVTAFVLGVSNSSRGIQDATNSADAQLLSTFFEPDVSSAEAVSTTSACGAGGTVVIAFGWVDGTESKDVAYRTVADAQASADLGTSVSRLVRHECSSLGTAVQQTLARSLASAPTLACDDTPCTSTTSKPRRVTITATQVGRTAADGNFSFSLTAARKVTP